MQRLFTSLPKSFISLPDDAAKQFRLVVISTLNLYHSKCCKNMVFLCGVSQKNSCMTLCRWEDVYYFIICLPFQVRFWRRKIKFYQHFPLKIFEYCCLNDLLKFLRPFLFTPTFYSHQFLARKQTLTVSYSVFSVSSYTVDTLKQCVKTATRVLSKIRENQEE